MQIAAGRERPHARQDVRGGGLRRPWLRRHLSRRTRSSARTRRGGCSPSPTGCASPSAWTASRARAVSATCSTRRGGGWKCRLKIDSGFRRVGVRPEDAVAMARRIAELAGLRLPAIFTHAGQGYGGPTPEDVARTGGEEGRIVVEAAEAVRAAGLPVEDVSLGSTPTARAGDARRGRHRVPAGHVRLQRPFAGRARKRRARGLRDDDPRDRRQRPGARPRRRRRRIEDALDATRCDRTPTATASSSAPRAASRALRRSTASSPSPRATPSASASACAFCPNHTCAVSNLHDRLVAVRGEAAVEGEIRVAARGCVQ